MGSNLSQEEHVEWNEQSIIQRNYDFIDSFVGKKLDAVSFASLSKLGYSGVIVRPEDTYEMYTPNTTSVLVIVDKDEIITDMIYEKHE